MGDSTARGKSYLALATGIPKERLKRRGEITNPNDDDGGVSKREELVHAGDENYPNKTDDPSA